MFALYFGAKSCSCRLFHAKMRGSCDWRHTNTHLIYFFFSSVVRHFTVHAFHFLRIFIYISIHFLSGFLNFRVLIRFSLFFAFCFVHFDGAAQISDSIECHVPLCVMRNRKTMFFFQSTEHFLHKQTRVDHDIVMFQWWRSSLFGLLSASPLFLCCDITVLSTLNKYHSCFCACVCVRKVAKNNKSAVSEIVF